MTMVVSHWLVNAAVLVIYAVIAAAHLLGVRGAVAGARKRDDRLPAGQVREAVIFQAGLLIAALALVSPLGRLAHVYIWVRSVQDLLLALVAPGLVVLGAPWEPLARALRLPAPRAAAGPDAPARPRPGWLTVPAGVTAGYCVIWLGWHLPAAYDGSARQPWLYAAEVIMYLGAGIAWWRQLIGSRPYRPAFAPVYRTGLLAATLMSATVLGMILTFGSGLAYPAYRTPAHLHPASVIADQQIGGAVLWLLAWPPLFIAGVALLTRWLSEEEAGTASAGLDRMLKPRTTAWPSRPGLR